MEKYTDLQEKVLSESKKLVDNLGKIQSVQNLLDSEEDLLLLLENISFFRVLDRNTGIQFQDVVDQSFENQDKEDYNFEINEEEMKEEAIFNNELNEIDTEENFISDYMEEINVGEDETELFSEAPQETERLFVETFPNDEVFAEETELEAPIISKVSRETHEEIGKRKIVDIDSREEDSEKKQAYAEEKKLKLAKIRGLVNEDSLGEAINVEFNETSSILKTNVATEYMEAEKPKPEFKLDINDRIAFTKTLFGGSQTELNETINQLNSFKTVEEAKEFLSEEYYKRKWEKQEEFAQRLWSLVENKFL